MAPTPGTLWFKTASEFEYLDDAEKTAKARSADGTIDFTAELPRLPTGKLYKRELRDRYWAGHTSRIV